MDSILYNDIRVPVILDRPLYTGKSIKEVYSNLNITHVIGSSTPIVDGSSTPIVDGSSDTSVELYSILTKTLEITLTPDITGRFWHSMVAISNDIYIYGGYDGTSVFYDFYKIDTKTNIVTEITIMKDDNPFVMPERYGHSMVAISNDIYIFGGFDGTDYFNDFYKIDTKTKILTQITTPIESTFRSRYDHSMVAISNDIYIFGGLGIGSYNELWKIDTVSNIFTLITTEPNYSIPDKYMHSMVALNNDIYIYGGIYGTNELYKIDTTTFNVTTIFTQEPNVLPHLYNHSMVALNNDIYIYGGKLNENEVDTFYKIDTITCNVMTIFQNGASTNEIPAIHSHSMVELNNEIYIFGGSGTSGQHNNLWKISKDPSITYEIPTKTLEITSDYLNIQEISKRFSHSMVAISNDIYIFGGYDGVMLNDFYKIDTLNKSVTQITNTIPARHRHCMVAISNDIYIFGGDNNDTSFYKIDTLTNNTVTIITTEIPYRNNHSMVAINNDIYIFGGFGNTLYNDLWRMDTTICNATQINHTSFNTLSTQYAHSMVAINNELYIYGGYSKNDLYKINTTTCNVTTLIQNGATNTIPLLVNISMVALNNDIYIYGGYKPNEALSGTDTFYKIDTITCNVMTIFQDGASTNEIPALYNHSMVELNNEIYIFGGQGPSGQYNNLWKITGPSSSSEDP
jgi:N-acetylneuraminic acid mutarotase